MCPCATCARPDAGEADAEPLGMAELVQTMTDHVREPERNIEGDFLFAVDHCFVIKGKGTVLTGTVLAGKVSVMDEVELAGQKVLKKVKSMQMFKKPLETAVMGDRLGICVTQFDAKKVERGVLCTPGSLPAMTAIVCKVDKIRFFKSTCKTKTKFHLSLGHDTVMCTATFFGR